MELWCAHFHPLKRFVFVEVSDIRGKNRDGKNNFTESICMKVSLSNYF